MKQYNRAEIIIIIEHTDEAISTFSVSPASTAEQNGSVRVNE